MRRKEDCKVFHYYSKGGRRVETLPAKYNITKAETKVDKNGVPIEKKIWIIPLMKIGDEWVEKE